MSKSLTIGYRLYVTGALLPINSAIHPVGPSVHLPSPVEIHPGQAWMRLDLSVHSFFSFYFSFISSGKR